MPQLFDPPEERKLTNGAIAVLCKQQATEWFALRFGIPTASRFAEIVTTKGVPTKSQSRERYKYELIAERLTRTITMHHSTEAMERGVALEPQARAWYEMQTGVEVEQVGFVFEPERRWGGSPDGLIENGGIEIKCPLRHTVVQHLLEDGLPTCYMTQVQGCMWLCGRKQWDCVLFSDISDIPSRIYTVEADEKLHAAFAEHIAAFAAEIEAGVQRIKEIANAN